MNTFLSKPSNHHLRKFQTGFTLVELLVVIGIIAVLIGILLPALKKARDSSRTTLCMSNLHQISLGLTMYSLDNKDHYPDVQSLGGAWMYRRQPGLKDLADPGSYPEWMGMAAVLHGIRITDYNLNDSADDVQTQLNTALGRSAKYLPATSKVWTCPAFPDRFIQYGNTYCYSVSSVISPMTSIQRGIYANRNITVVFDNSNLLPFKPIGRVYGGTGASGLSFNNPLLPHPWRTSGKKTPFASNALFLDGRVDTWVQNQNGDFVTMH